MIEVKVLIEGYAKWIEAHKQKACGTITLIKGNINNCIVDTGNVGDEGKIIKALVKESLTPNDINFVINTHGDIDHIGNNSLFKKATFISGHDVCKGDEFLFYIGIYEIESGIKVIGTPGHSLEDVSVEVKTSRGVVVVTGDLFESENDTKDESWKVFSKYPENQIKSRVKVLEIADFVIPGHGRMFKVKKELQ